MSDLFCIRDEVEKPGGKQVDADVGGLIVGQQQRQSREFIPTQKNLIKKHSTNSVISNLLFWWKFHFSDILCSLLRLRRTYFSHLQIPTTPLKLWKYADVFIFKQKTSPNLVQQIRRF